MVPEILSRAALAFPSDRKWCIRTHSRIESFTRHLDTRPKKYIYFHFVNKVVHIINPYTIFPKSGV